MDKLVVIKLDGNCETQGFRYSLQIAENNQFCLTDITGKQILPANPELAAFEQEHWQQKYRTLGAHSRGSSRKTGDLIYQFLHKNVKKYSPVKSAKGLSFRIKPKKISNRHSLNECTESGKKLAQMLNDWLNCPEFANVDRLIGDNLNKDEEARVLICTDDKHLQKLPWHRWNLFTERFSKAEVSLSKLNYISSEKLRKPVRKSRVKILVILGNSDGINVAEDRKSFNNLSANAEVKFLVEPKREEINDRLWEESWDIIFFAGHGETEDDTGKIYINETDCLTIDELWYGLKKAVNNGLQLAIFNCCDGLGLATKLDDFQMIPQMILMRELVPDFVAQEFLKFFLKEFVAGKSLYAAAREARQRLETMENRFPCASWLPVIWQHPAAVPPVWSDFLIQPDAPAIVKSLPDVCPPAPKPPVKVVSSLVSVILASTACTWAVMGGRYFGAMQARELAAFDRLMGLREPELIDNRLLLVEVTDSDAVKYNYPQNDATLAKALAKLEQFKPLAIGLNMHRYQAQPPGREDLIDLFKKNPNLITVCAYNAAKRHEPPPEFSQNQLNNQVGFSNLVKDEKPNEKGESIRIQPLSYHPNLSSFTDNCKSPNSFSLLLALRFLENQGYKMEKNANEELVIGGVKFPRLAVRTGGYQNIDAGVNQILLNYRANPKPAFKVTLQQVLEGKINADLVRGKIVIIGHASETVGNNSDTAYGKMPGVWIQAHMVSQILSAVIDKRRLLWVLPQWQGMQWGDAIVVWLAALAGGLLAWRGRSPLVLAAGGSLVIFVLYQAAIVMLSFGGWMPLIPSVMALICTGCIWFIYDRYALKR
ncbi:MAG: CHASE2 domain-containing protein [Microcoleus sp.]|uniref:CHASE2 domain-containing protein n=1 Tax=Microcoleus sp. TaxID=44472 RepID=UPI003C75B252